MTTGCLLPDRNLPTGLPNHEAYFMVSLEVGLLPTVNLIATSCQTELDGMTIGLNRRPDGMRDIDCTDHYAVVRCSEGWEPPWLNAYGCISAYLSPAGANIVDDGIFVQDSLVSAVQNWLGNMPR